MVIDVVGIQHKQGTVEGRPYEFFEVHSLVPDVLADVLGEVGGLPQNLIGKRLFVDYDRKMRPASVQMMREK